MQVLIKHVCNVQVRVITVLELRLRALAASLEDISIILLAIQIVQR